MTEGLELRSVCSGYGATEIVHAVDLDVPAGGCLAVLGRNGAGKSTLVGTIAGRVQMRSGSIRLGGRELGRQPPNVRCRAGLALVPQGRQIFQSLTVRENLEIADLRRGWTSERVCDFFPRLAERASHMAGQLSGGERQMLAIGRALMSAPRCLLLDEPFEGLAPVVVEMLLSKLQLLRTETEVAIVFVEQNPAVALEFAESALVLERGRVLLRGTSEALRRNWRELESALSFGSETRALCSPPEPKVNKLTAESRRKKV